MNRFKPRLTIIYEGKSEKQLKKIMDSITYEELREMFGLISKYLKNVKKY